MRKDGGGLICTAVHPVAAQRLGLPFASDALRAIAVAEREATFPMTGRITPLFRSG